MAKMIAFDQEAQDKIRQGVSKLAKAVRVTLRVHRVIEIPRGLAINGDQRQLAQIDTRLRFTRIDVSAELLRLAQRFR